MYLQSWNSSLWVYPERWGIITSCKFGGTEILYQAMLDDTLLDESKSVRGGIPILFPQAGPITQQEAEILSYSLPQHGVVRQRVWEVLDSSENSLCLQYSQNTQESEFPFDFSLENSISLQQNILQLTFSLINLGNTDFPYSYGFHPYFSIPDGNKDAIIWDTRYQEEISHSADIWKHDGTISLKAQDGYFDFEIGHIGKIRLTFSPEIKNIWIWSLSGKNFVCIEPVVWNEGNITRNPEIIHPQEEKNFFFSLQKIS